MFWRRWFRAVSEDSHAPYGDELKVTIIIFKPSTTSFSVSHNFPHKSLLFERAKEKTRVNVWPPQGAPLMARAAALSARSLDGRLCLAKKNDQRLSKNHEISTCHHDIHRYYIYTYTYIIYTYMYIHIHSIIFLYAYAGGKDGFMMIIRRSGNTSYPMSKALALHSQEPWKPGVSERFLDPLKPIWTNNNGESNALDYFR